MSLVLAFDTATEDVALALGRFSDATRSPAGGSGIGGGPLTVVGSRDFHAPRAALSRLLPAVRELLSETGTEAISVRTVVVGRGPGSFTGVRIGVSMAKGLAHGLGAALFGVGTLDAIAWRFAEERRIVAVVGDAMRGEVYPALFRCGEGACVRLTGDIVSSPQEAAASWAAMLEGPAGGGVLGGGDGAILLAGNGLTKHARVFIDALRERAEIAPPETWAPTGESLLRAAQAAAVGDGDPVTVLPVYTRLSDAEEAERVRRDATSPTPPATGVAGPEGS